MSQIDRSCELCGNDDGTAEMVCHRCIDEAKEVMQEELAALRARVDLVPKLVEAIDYHHAVPFYEHKYCMICSGLMRYLEGGGRICENKDCPLTKAREVINAE